MTISEGDTIPSGTFSYVPYSPELSSAAVCGVPTKLNTDDWKGKKIVLFGVPGAFTKSCSVNHLPHYIKKAPELKSKGVSSIYCISANDAFVISAWGRLHGTNEHIEMLSDWSLEWLEKAGLAIDLSSNGLGKRGTRFALIIDDLKVKYVGIEPAPGSVTVSGVDSVLAKL
ncbi:Redoxin [Phakopsora pachyrhizi]|uniref:Putative peroxiredoxin n=1 Tax=Phakopsora pachyrhizi TaxID=170000 RepID=A0AAV0B608_PHAPC|nr:Redoxin [Phakopsora pachyrhizi]CAH7686193.1 Redoxin [Phakopsora pachyrhizi]